MQKQGFVSAGPSNLNFNRDDRPGFESHLEAPAIAGLTWRCCQAGTACVAAVAWLSNAVEMSRMLMTPIRL